MESIEGGLRDKRIGCFPIAGTRIGPESCVLESVFHLSRGALPTHSGRDALLSESCNTVNDTTALERSPRFVNMRLSDFFGTALNGDVASFQK